MSDQCPYLTADVPAIPLTIRTLPQDFRVEEIPAYEASGEGSHVYITIEKTGVSTHDAVKRIARGVGFTQSQFGYAGLKDARAVAIQTLSTEHLDPERLQEFQDSQIRVLSVTRHKNKIKTGHLKGNRFILKLRGMDLSRLTEFEAVLERLKTKGVPNYFGSQRFGMRGDSWEIGQALLKEDYERAACLMAGNPGPLDSGRILQARELFMKAQYREAANLWPSSMSFCGILCRLMESKPDNFRRGVRSLDKKILRFFVSAFQSRLFNELLARRVSAVDQVMAGDWAVKHESGGMFKVEDPAVENLRAARFEISATGPLFGKKTRISEGEPARMEDEILAEYGSARTDFHLEGLLACEGDRRPFRFRPEEVSWKQDQDELGDFVELKTLLPAGCYVTTFLREIAKDKLTEIHSSHKPAAPASDQG